MRSTFLLACLLIPGIVLHAQQKGVKQADTGVRMVVLNDFILSGKAPVKYSNRARPQHVSFIFKSGDSAFQIRYDSAFFVTGFPAVANTPIRLEQVELRLKSCDTSLLQIRFIVFQISGGDTMQQIIPVPIQDIKNNRLKLSLSSADIIIRPDSFYLGYCFVPTRQDKDLRYRVFSTSRGHSAIISFYRGAAVLTRSIDGPYVFPFKIGYTAL